MDTAGIKRNTNPCCHKCMRAFHPLHWLCLPECSLVFKDYGYKMQLPCSSKLF
jgi:hypothetical protein